MTHTASLVLLALIGGMLMPAALRADEAVADPLPAFRADLKAKADAAPKNVVAGKDGWLFFGGELRSLSLGPFWGEHAVKVSKATKPQNADPLPAILDFKAQLDKKGIELIMVPIPAKATIYPEKVSEALTVPDGQLPPRVDAAQAEFYTLLKGKGITVLDLTPLFLQHRADQDGPLYCKNDSHWSPYAIALLARLLAEDVNKRPWVKEVAKHQYVAEEKTVSIPGDLKLMLADPAVPDETLSVTVVEEQLATGKAPVASWRDSPVVLLGDSHNLVFSAGGDMLVSSAGLPEHLTRQLGFPVDVVAVRGSGATPARGSLAMRRDSMAGKKLVIWCFTARDFTESIQGWGLVPIIK